MDDGIWTLMEGHDIDSEMRLLQRKGQKIEDQGHPSYSVCVNIAKTNDGQYVFTQPLLIDAVINDVGIQQRQSVPMSA